MQNKKNIKVKKTKNKRGGMISSVISLILFTLTIPALSLIEIPKETDEPKFTIQFDMSNNSNKDNNTVSQIEDEVKEVNQIAPAGISQEDFDTNNFYLIQNHKTGEVINLTPTEYIKGVVSAEMPMSFHDEALKAQAITAHSYALRQIENAINSNDDSLNGAYISTDSNKFQAYFSKEERQSFWGDDKFDEYEERLYTIVKEVITQIAVVENEPIIGAFHSLSNGKTESAQEVWGESVTYLISAQSEWDKYSPNYEMTKNLSIDEVENALKKAYPNIKLDSNINNWFTQIELNESDRISSIKAGDIVLTGHELRTILKLRSASFEVYVEGEEFIFTQIGYGHGVGLSQYGADYMARQGYNYEEILKHYFNGIEIVLLK